MEITRHTENLNQFRTTLYQTFPNRADTLFELVDAISSTPDAKSVVEYSLADCFRRSYSSLFKAVNEIKIEEKTLPHLLAPYLPKPKKWPFWLLIADVTPHPRPYAKTLEDRGMVYQAETVKGKLPITIGHQYSTVVQGLEPENGVSSSWVLPLLTKRVSTTENKEMVGAEQMNLLLEDECLPYGRELTVEAVDSSYSKPEYLYFLHKQHQNLISIGRARSTRVFYHQYVPTAEEKARPKPGCPKQYGERFALNDSSTWTKADDETEFWETSRRGKEYKVKIQSWHNMLMSGKEKPERIPMHNHPFTLVCITRFDKDGNEAFKNPLWLVIMGKRRHELILQHIYEAYCARFDIEHFFRFGKNKLLLVHFQTPEVEREENWFLLAHIAYAQLWMARHVAELLPRPWERYLPSVRHGLLSPTMVQRDFSRIIRQLGTPTKPPKPRINSPGRPYGTILPKRPKQPVFVKSQQSANSA